MKQTNTSNRVYPTLIKKTGIKVVIDALTKQLAIKDITICPALILAINRTVKVKGRIRILTVSTKMRNGTKAEGAPAGAKWAADCVGLKSHPLKSNNPHITTAIEEATHKFLVTP